MKLATFETSHYTFSAIFPTKTKIKDIVQSFRDSWLSYCESSGADPDLFESGELNIMTIKVGGFYRDYSLINKK